MENDFLWAHMPKKDEMKRKTDEMPENWKHESSNTDFSQIRLTLQRHFL